MIILLLFVLLITPCYAVDIDGAVIINNNPNTTKIKTVDLIVLAADSLSGVQDMCLSIGTTCYAWQPYTKNTYVTLVGNIGEWFTICSKVRDRAGNESTQSCAQIQLVGE